MLYLLFFLCMCVFSFKYYTECKRDNRINPLVNICQLPIHTRLTGANLCSAFSGSTAGCSNTSAGVSFSASADQRRSDCCTCTSPQRPCVAATVNRLARCWPREEGRSRLPMQTQASLWNNCTLRSLQIILIRALRVCGTILVSLWVPSRCISKSIKFQQNKK